MVRVLRCGIGGDIGALRVDHPQGTLILLDVGVTDPDALLADLLSPEEMAEIAV